MSLFLPLYLRLTKNRFVKPFKPLASKKRVNYLISSPHNLADFLKTLPFLGDLRDTLGKVFLLMPRAFASIIEILTPDLFETIYYKNQPVLFSKEAKILKEKLSERDFYSLIELNVPANISLPYLFPAEKRISFYDEKCYPFYNILIKGNIAVLQDFFKIKKKNPERLFKFYKADLKKIEAKLHKQRPLLFVNPVPKPELADGVNISWSGDKFVRGEGDFSLIDTYKILYLGDAYYGQDDEFLELAKIFNKKIITS